MKTMNILDINDYDYPLPDGRIAKFPLERRDASRLLVYRDGDISERTFADIGSVVPRGSLFVFNDTKVVRARLIMHKPSGARIEVFCLEPHAPADYERAFAVRGACEWSCIVGNLKKWKEGDVYIDFRHGERDCRLTARVAERGTREHVVRFGWDADMTFGQLLEYLGRIPIPPYLNRDSEEIDNTRYQTVYSRFEGSVAAPTAGLHFTGELIERLRGEGFGFATVTLHVGAGTFLPVKEEDARNHPMHTEHFDITLASLRQLHASRGRTIAVGTTSVRTLESLPALGWRIRSGGDPQCDRTVGQWEPYDIPADYTGAAATEDLTAYMEARGLERLKASTRIMITPRGFRYRMVDGIVTNFHQPRSTLLLLVSAYVGGDWRRIYDYALAHGFRFLSYGDSSVLMVSRDE